MSDCKWEEALKMVPMLMAVPISPSATAGKESFLLQKFKFDAQNPRQIIANMLVCNNSVSSHG